MQNYGEIDRQLSVIEKSATPEEYRERYNAFVKRNTNVPKNFQKRLEAISSHIETVEMLCDAREFLSENRLWQTHTENYTIDELILLKDDDETQSWKDYIDSLDLERITPIFDAKETINIIKLLVHIRDENIQYGLEHLEELVRRDIIRVFEKVTMNLQHLFENTENVLPTREQLLQLLLPYNDLFLKMYFLETEFYTTTHVGNHFIFSKRISSTDVYKSGVFKSVYSACEQIKVDIIDKLIMENVEPETLLLLAKSYVEIYSASLPR